MSVPDLSALELVLALAMAGAGAVVQGVIGFGYALVVVPTLLLVAPASVPATSLLLALPMVLAMAVRERDAIVVPTAVRLTVGRVPGTALGAVVVSAVAVDTVTVVIGVLLLATVALSGVSASVRSTPTVVLGAGFVSGVVGTLASLGGPVMGLALQSWSPRALRATLACAFATGVALSLGALALAGEVSLDALVLALVLAPATLLGLGLSRRLADRLAGRALRPAVLAFAAAGGVAAIARVVLG